MTEKIKVVTVVTEINGQEAIYVDGSLEFRDDTVYACEIAHYAGDGPILLRHAECEFQDEYWKWPEKLHDVRLLPENTSVPFS